MKKVYYLVMIFSLLLLLSGCQKGYAEPVGSGSKNIKTNTQLLKCNMDFDDGIEETEKSSKSLEIFYKDDSISKISWVLGYKLKDTFTSDSVTALERNIMEKQKNKYNKFAPITVSSNRKGTTSFEIVIEIDYKKLTPEDLEEIELGFLKEYSEDRRVYENSGFTCE